MACRSGAIDVPELLRRTAPVWRRFARYLLRKWRAPLGVDEEDVVQEVLAAGIPAIKAWDPSRGPAIDAYVQFQALDKAKKWLHTQRKAKRRDDSAPSRAPLTYTQLGLETAADIERVESFRTPWSATPEEVATEREAIARVAEQLRAEAQRFVGEDRGILTALADARLCVDDAAESLPLDVRIGLRLSNVDGARAVVRRAIDRLRASTGGSAS